MKNNIQTRSIITVIIGLSDSSENFGVEILRNFSQSFSLFPLPAKLQTRAQEHLLFHRGIIVIFTGEKLNWMNSLSLWLVVILRAVPPFAVSVHYSSRIWETKVPGRALCPVHTLAIITHKARKCKVLRKLLGPTSKSIMTRQKRYMRCYWLLSFFSFTPNPSFIWLTTTASLIHEITDFHIHLKYEERDTLLVL